MSDGESSQDEGNEEIKHLDKLAKIRETGSSQWWSRSRGRL